ncbi:MAG: PAS domain S-box protein [Candidatus Euphemobacter frigidus]|nr:PAS domain S-box protein [Candidatus Euphemobacter frigidus]MDP8276505.1 PAS domain S-box protein [Candidatus Euphemobacter frigidus]
MKKQKNKKAQANSGEGSESPHIPVKSLFHHPPQEQISRLSCALASLADAVYITGLNHKIIYANPAIEAIHGYRPGEVIGKAASDFFEEIPGNPPDLAGLIKREAKDGFWIGEIYNRRKDGSIFPAQLIENTIFGEGGEVMGYIGISRDITQIRRDKQELAESREKYRLLTESSLTGIYIISKNGEILYTNRTFKTLSGYSDEDLLGENIFKFIHPDDVDWVKDNLKCRLKGEAVPERYECRAYRKDGSLGWIEIRSAKINYQGKVTVLGNFINITDRKEAEVALRREKEMSRKYLDIAGVILLVIDTEGKIRLINRKGCEITGYTESELIGRSYYNTLVPERVRESSRKGFFRLMRGEIDIVPEVEVPLVRKDGEERIIFWRNAVLTDGDGRFIGSVNSGEDITERKQAEEELRAQKAKLTKIFDVAPFAIFLETMEGKIIDCNPAACRMLGYTHEELLRMSVEKLLPPEDRVKMMENMEKELATGGGFRETRNIRKDGEIFPVVVSFKLIELNGKNYSFVVVHDITSQKEAEERLRQASKLETVGTMSLGMAHEINNILMGISGYAQLAHTDISNQDMTRKAFKTILRLVARAKAMIRRLSVFGKREKPQPRPAALTKIIDEVIKFQERELYLSDIKVIKEYNHPSLIMADFLQMEQVFFNLILNARQAIAPKREGRITIEIMDKEEMVEVRIRDTGIGIPPEDLSKIFIPFFTSKGIQEKSVIPSLGLGLWIVKQIVEEHGGEIEVESRLGEGTVFTVRLPITRNNVSPNIGKEPEVEEVIGTKKTLLVVDDEPDLLEIIRRYLSAHGIEVTVAEKGEEALSLCRENKFDFILLDYVMPGLSGKEMVGKVAEASPSSRLFIFTGQPIPEDDGLKLKPLVEAYLQKPTELKNLLRLFCV